MKISKELLFGVVIGVGIMGMFFVMYNNSTSYPHATTCLEIDEILTKHLQGEIELQKITIKDLSNNEFEDLIDVMIWCKEKGYEVKPWI